MSEQDLVRVPARGRFLIYDGKVYRIKDMWLEQKASDGRRKWGVVTWKEGER